MSASADRETTRAELLAAPEAEYAALAALDTETLRRELADSVRVTATTLRRLALIVRALEERGEDLADLRVGLLGYLRRIAHGQLLPEAVVQFGEAPGLLRTVASLPLPDQRRLASGQSIELVVRTASGYDRRMADPLRMPADSIRQVFAAGRIRDEAEQILYLEGRTAPRPAGPSPKVGRVTADRKRGGLRIGRTFAPLADVVGALAALRDREDAETGEAEPSTLVVRLSAEEHHRIKQAALDGRTTGQDLVRRALIAAGLI